MPTFRNNLSVPSSQAGRYEEWLWLRILGCLYGKSFGSKIAWACYPPSDWFRLFLSQNFSCINTPTFLKPSHSTPTRLWRWNRQSVPRCWLIKFRCRGSTHKKAYKIWFVTILRKSFRTFSVFIQVVRCFNDDLCSFFVCVLNDCAKYLLEIKMFCAEEVRNTFSTFFSVYLLFSLIKKGDATHTFSDFVWMLHRTYPSFPVTIEKASSDVHTYLPDYVVVCEKSTVVIFTALIT